MVKFPDMIMRPYSGSFLEAPETATTSARIFLSPVTRVVGYARWARLGNHHNSALRNLIRSRAIGATDSNGNCLGRLKTGEAWSRSFSGTDRRMGN